VSKTREYIDCFHMLEEKLRRSEGFRTTYQRPMFCAPQSESRVRLGFGITIRSKMLAEFPGVSGTDQKP